MIIIYTDGSCLTNPGKGGWAAIINDEKKIINQKNFDKDNNLKVSHGKKQHVIIKII